MSLLSVQRQIARKRGGRMWAQLALEGSTFSLQLSSLSSSTLTIISTRPAFWSSLLLLQSFRQVFLRVFLNSSLDFSCLLSNLYQILSFSLEQNSIWRRGFESSDLAPFSVCFPEKLFTDGVWLRLCVMLFVNSSQKSPSCFDLSPVQLFKLISRRYSSNPYALFLVVILILP